MYPASSSTRTGGGGAGPIGVRIWGGGEGRCGVASRGGDDAGPGCDVPMAGCLGDGVCGVERRRRQAVSGGGGVAKISIFRRLIRSDRCITVLTFDGRDGGQVALAVAPGGLCGPGDSASLRSALISRRMSSSRLMTVG
ncbi:hypothetical protein RF55_24282 [Lasius niger]|uniref:Uncharacterized protein n=1 Tax=Lasius niger TaxID=67767 RepID=A0A0J7JV23_LASNI|nr:hypothetical protein RF55_24282 [Lasius niger]